MWKLGLPHFLLGLLGLPHQNLGDFLKVQAELPRPQHAAAASKSSPFPWNEWRYRLVPTSFNFNVQDDDHQWNWGAPICLEKRTGELLILPFLPSNFEVNFTDASATRSGPGGHIFIEGAPCPPEIFVSQIFAFLAEPAQTQPKKNMGRTFKKSGTETVYSNDLPYTQGCFL